MKKPTDRELEILQYCASGMAYKEIAGLLGLSHQTVKNHLYNANEKMGMPNTVASVVVALREGWIQTPEIYRSR